MDWRFNTLKKAVAKHAILPHIPLISSLASTIDTNIPTSETFRQHNLSKQPIILCLQRLTCRDPFSLIYSHTDYGATHFSLVNACKLIHVLNSCTSEYYHLGCLCTTWAFSILPRKKLPNIQSYQPYHPTPHDIRVSVLVSLHDARGDPFGKL